MNIESVWGWGMVKEREERELRYEKEGLSWEQYVLQSNCSVFYRTWSLGYPAYGTAEM